MQRHIFLCAEQKNPKCAPYEETSEVWRYLKTRLKELDLTSGPPSWSGKPDRKPCRWPPAAGGCCATRSIVSGSVRAGTDCPRLSGGHLVLRGHGRGDGADHHRAPHRGRPVEEHMFMQYGPVAMKWMRRGLVVAIGLAAFWPRAAPSLAQTAGTSLEGAGADDLCCGSRALRFGKPVRCPGPPVVLVHGLAGSSMAEWYKVAPILAEETSADHDRPSFARSLGGRSWPFRDRRRSRRSRRHSAPAWTSAQRH